MLLHIYYLHYTTSNAPLLYHIFLCILSHNSLHFSKAVQAIIGIVWIAICYKIVNGTMVYVFAWHVIVNGICVAWHVIVNDTMVYTSAFGNGVIATFLYYFYASAELCYKCYCIYRHVYP